MLFFFATDYAAFRFFLSIFRALTILCCRALLSLSAFAAMIALTMLSARRLFCHIIYFFMRAPGMPLIKIDAVTPPIRAADCLPLTIPCYATCMLPFSSPCCACRHAAAAITLDTRRDRRRTRRA